MRMGGLEPPRLSTPDPKSGAAAITPRAPVFSDCKDTKFRASHQKNDPNNAEIFYSSKNLLNFEA